MNELVLFIVVASILLISQMLVSKFKKPMLHYIRISVSIALLVLVWFFSGDHHIPIKVVLSAISLTVLYREYINLKKAKAN